MEENDSTLESEFKFAHQIAIKYDSLKIARFGDLPAWGFYFESQKERDAFAGELVWLDFEHTFIKIKDGVENRKFACIIVKDTKHNRDLAEVPIGKGETYGSYVRI